MGGQAVSPIVHVEKFFVVNRRAELFFDLLLNHKNLADISLAKHVLLRAFVMRRLYVLFKKVLND